MKIDQKCAVALILREFPDMEFDDYPEDGPEGVFDFMVRSYIFKRLDEDNTGELKKVFSLIENLLSNGDDSVILDVSIDTAGLCYSKYNKYYDTILDFSGKLTRKMIEEQKAEQLIFDEVNSKLLKEFPAFTVDDDDINLGYIVASQFIDFILKARQRDGDEKTYEKGMQFIEELHLHKEYIVRELATIGYLESLAGENVSIEDFGEETKKWWIELNKFLNGEIDYIGETYEGDMEGDDSDD